MVQITSKHRPGEIRDAILDVLRESGGAMSLREIEVAVSSRLVEVPGSSVRSYLRLNTPDLFERPRRAHYSLREQASLYFGSGQTSAKARPLFQFGDSRLYNDDCFNWIRKCAPRSIHAVVTDPPYGLVEYSAIQQEKLRARRGGVWRIPPSFDGESARRCRASRSSRPVTWALWTCSSTPGRACYWLP